MIIIFKQDGAPDVKVLAEKGENLLALAERAGVAVDAPCAGSGTCGKCRMKLIAGSVEMARSPRLSREEFREGWRLACQSTVNSDATLWVPAQASAFREDIRTADLGSEEELRRYEAQIAEILGERPLSAGRARRFGVAVDIGTTTVTAALLELSTGEVLAKASLGNGQIRYGADVINRIIQQSRPGGREKLRRAVREETVLPILARMPLDPQLAALTDAGAMDDFAGTLLDDAADILESL